MPDGAWRWADAWIFASVVIAHGAGQHRRSPSSRRPEGIRLVDVLSTADHLNRALPTREEVELAVRRLIGVGLISVTDGWFRVSPDGAELWRNRPRCGLSTIVDTIHTALMRRCPPHEAQWRLSDDEHGAAVQEYLRRRMMPTPRRSTVERIGRTEHGAPPTSG